MAIICPDFRNPDVAREFEELKNATREAAAYHIWSLNNGNAIDKAPNGANSILFNTLLLLFNGDRTKAIEAKAKVYGNGFLTWFGDWINDSANASKVVDENGEPLVVYHGGAQNIKAFKLPNNKAVISFDSIRNLEWAKEEGYILSEEDLEKYNNGENVEVIKPVGIYFAAHEVVSRSYFGSRNPEDEGLYATFLNIRNPYITNKKGKLMPGDAATVKDLQQAKDNNQDGVIIENVRDYGPNDEERMNWETNEFADYPTTDYVVFTPNQIKSAVDNIGTFSRYSDIILFGMNTLDYQFDPIVLNAVLAMADAMGVSIREINFNRSDILAAANFMNKTIDITDNVEDRAAAWDKLPEEVAHFWFRLLSHDSLLKKDLYEAAKKSDKYKQLMELNYGNYEDFANADELFLEEAVGLLIAEAIYGSKLNMPVNKQPESVQASMIFFAKFWEKIKLILEAFKRYRNTPFEEAALRILNSDLRELLDINSLVEAYLPAESYDEEQEAYDSGSPLLSASDYLRLNLEWKLKLFNLIRKATTEIDYYLYIELVIESIKQRFNLINQQTFAKRLSESIETKPLLLLSLDLFLKKYKQGVPLTLPISMNNVPLIDTYIYQLAVEFAKSTDDSYLRKKTIPIGEFVLFLNAYLESNNFGFSHLNSWNNYGISRAFKSETSHVITGVYIGGYGATGGHFGNMQPLAFGNYTPIYDPNGNVTGVIIHLIQSDIAEQRYWVDRLQPTDKQIKEFNDIVEDVIHATPAKRLKWKSLPSSLLNAIFSMPTVDQVTGVDIRARIEHLINFLEDELLFSAAAASVLKYKDFLKNPKAEQFRGKYVTREWIKKEVQNIFSQFNSPSEFFNYYEAGHRLFYISDGHISVTAPHVVWDMVAMPRLYKNDGTRLSIPLIINRAIYKINNEYAKSYKNYKESLHKQVIRYYSTRSKIQYLKKLLLLSDEELLHINMMLTGLNDLEYQQKAKENPVVKQIVEEFIEGFYNNAVDKNLFDKYPQALFHSIIQEIIQKYGRNVPVYFSGYNASTLLQGNTIASKLYAGPVEVKLGIVKAVGPIWAVLNKLRGVKLLYVQHIPGMKGLPLLTHRTIPQELADLHNAPTTFGLIDESQQQDTEDSVDGYMLDLSNYNYTQPMLYGMKSLQLGQSVQQEPVIITSDDVEDISAQYEEQQRNYVLSKLKELTYDANEDRLLQLELALYEATLEWGELVQGLILSDTQQALAQAFGLQLMEDGSYASVNDLDDLVVQFINSLGDGHAGSYTMSQESDLAHNTILIGLDQADATTFNHELAHYYVRKFWNSSVIQEALRSIDKEGMTDLEREEALVDKLTELSVENMFGDNEKSWFTKTWNKINMLIHSMFNIMNNNIRTQLVNNAARAFVVNELLKLNEDSHKMYTMYNGTVYQTRSQSRFNKRSQDLSSIMLFRALNSDVDELVTARIVNAVLSRQKAINIKGNATQQLKIDLFDFTERIKVHAKIIQQSRINVQKGIESVLQGEAKQREHKSMIMGFFLDNVRDNIADVETQLATNKIALDSGLFTGNGVLTYDDLYSLKTDVIGYYYALLDDLLKFLDDVGIVNAAYNSSVRQQYDLTTIDLLRIMTNDLKEQCEVLLRTFKTQQKMMVMHTLESILELSMDTLDPGYVLRAKITLERWIDNDNLFGDASGFRDFIVGLASHSSSMVVRMLHDTLEDIDDLIYNEANERGRKLRDLLYKARAQWRKKHLAQSIAHDITTIGGYGAGAAYGAALGSSIPILGTVVGGAMGAIIGGLIGGKVSAAIGPGRISGFEKQFIEINQDTGLPTGDFIRELNYGTWRIRKERYQCYILYNYSKKNKKKGIEQRIREFLNDPEYELQIDEYGFPYFPDGCELFEKEYLLKMNDWHAKNTEREFTPAYYEKRAEILSIKTLRALRNIQNRINEIIDLCRDINGDPDLNILSDNLRALLAEYQRDKENLSNPYDITGRKKTGDGAQIAEELYEWNQFLQSSGIVYSTDLDAYRAMRSNSKNAKLFDLLWSTRIINPQLYDLLPPGAHKTERYKKLKYALNKLLSLIKAKGYTSPNIGMIWDDQNKLIDRRFLEFLKSYAELEEDLEQESKNNSKGPAPAEPFVPFSDIFEEAEVKNQQNQKWFSYIANELRRRFLATGNPTWQADYQAELALIRKIGSNKALSFFFLNILRNPRVGQLDPNAAYSLPNDDEFLPDADQNGNFTIITLQMLDPSTLTRLEPRQFFGTVRQVSGLFKKLNKQASNPKYVNLNFNKDKNGNDKNYSDKYGSHPKVSIYNNEKNFNKIEGESRVLYDMLINEMKTEYNRIGIFKNGYDYRLPQIGGDATQLTRRRKNFFATLAWGAKRAFLFVETDDFFNDEWSRRPDGSIVLNPKLRFIKRLDDPWAINTDVVGSVIKFIEMATEYDVKRQNQGKIESILDVVRTDKNYNANSVQTKKIQHMINTLFYGRNLTFNDKGELEDSEKGKGKRFGLKTLKQLRVFAQVQMLAYNFTSSIVSALDPWTKLLLDAITGKYQNVLDLIKSLGTIILLAPGAIRSLGRSRTTSLVLALMRRHGIAETIGEIYGNLDRSSAIRFLTDNLGMKLFTFGDYTTSAMTMVTMMKNFRFYYNATDHDKSTFYQKDEYIRVATKDFINSGDDPKTARKNAKKAYKKARTALSMYDYSNAKDGIKIKNNEATKYFNEKAESRIRKAIKSRISIYNAIVQGNEKTVLLTKIWYSFVAMLRNFLLVGINERFKNLHDFLVDPNKLKELQGLSPELDRQGNPVQYGKEQILRMLRDYAGGWNFLTRQIENGVYTGMWHTINNFFNNIGLFVRFFKDHPGSALLNMLHVHKLVSSGKIKTFSDYKNAITQSKNKSYKVSKADAWGLQKFIIELTFIAAQFLLWAFLIHPWASGDDKKDEFVPQLADYISLRLMVETSSWVNPMTISDIISSITPSTGDLKKKLVFIELIMRIKEAFDEDPEIVKRGGFKGLPRWTKSLGNVWGPLGNYITNTRVEGIKSKMSYYNKIGFYGPVYKFLFDTADQQAEKKNKSKSKKKNSLNSNPFKNSLNKDKLNKKF